LCRNPPPRCPERLAQRGLGAGVDAFAVAAHDAFRREPLQLLARRAETHERMHRNALVGRPVVPRRPERVRADEDAPLGPPERDLLPPPRVSHGEELERRAGKLVRDKVMRHAESRGELRAIAVMTVEQLDHPGRLAGGANPFFDAVARDGIDQPDTAVSKERMGAAFQELVGDPAEAGVELVADADGHAGDTMGTPYAESAAATTASST
jgi:hypothetical protein